MRLNLGSCDRMFPGFTSVDIQPPADVVTDLESLWPWPTSSVDEILALDIVEHLRNRIFTMNEMWRVLKPGGRVTIETPNAARGAGAFQDPTHCSYWCLNSFQYYEAGSFAVQRLASSYGIVARFKIIELSEREFPDVRETVWKIRAILEAVK